MIFGNDLDNLLLWVFSRMYTLNEKKHMKEDGTKQAPARDYAEYIERIKKAKPGVYFLSCAESVFQTHKKYAKKYFRLGKYVDAADCCRTVLRMTSKDAESLAYLGLCLAIPECDVFTNVWLLQEDVPEIRLTNHNRCEALYLFLKKAYDANPDNVYLGKKLECACILADLEISEAQAQQITAQVQALRKT